MCFLRSYRVGLYLFRRGGKNERSKYSKNIFSKQNLSGKVADQMQLETLAGVAGRISAVYLLGIWDAYCWPRIVCSIFCIRS